MFICSIGTLVSVVYLMVSTEYFLVYFFLANLGGCSIFAIYYSLKWAYIDIKSPPSTRIAFGKYLVRTPPQIIKSPVVIRRRKSALRSNSAYKRALRRRQY